MKLVKKATDQNIAEDFYEEYFSDYEDALLDFQGDQEPSYTEGFGDDIFNYKQLISFLGKSIVIEEKETKKKIDDAWHNEEDDLRYRYSYVGRLREFTLHSTFVSIHSMYEMRLKEFAIILNQFQKKRINFSKDPGFTELRSKIRKCLALPQKSQESTRFNYYNDVRNTIVHHRGYLDSKTQTGSKLYSQIAGDKYLKVTNSSIGRYDYRMKIAKSNFLTEYLNLIEQDLKLISRIAMKF